VGLIVVLGSRAVEIEGHRLGILTNQVREGQINGIQELVSRQAPLLETEHDRGGVEYRALLG
jgi:hypothetical protein